MMKLRTTIVYQKTDEAYKAGHPIIIHQGGTRSGKTYNILIWLIIMAQTKWNNKVIDITRDTMTALRASAMFDFFQILEKLNLYYVDSHNKSENIYRLGSNIFRFFGTDDDQKVRGPGRDIIFINEMNGVKHSVYKQLNQRTKELMIGDYNPSDEFHWIYENILVDKDCFFFKTTFKDNDHLPARIIKAIEKYKETDPNYWRIYGLGERGLAQATIYSNWDYTDNKFEDFEGQEFFGLDFGFNNPTAMVRIRYHEVGIFMEQLIYKSQLTSDLIVLELDKLKEKKILTYDSTIYADGARPEIIEDIRKAGYNIQKANKEKDSVLRGINFIKRHKIWIPKESLDLIKEFRTYKWKVDKDDHVLDVPVDLNDHLMDSCRYGLNEVSGYGGERGILDGGEMFGDL